ncbi:MAG: sigma-70 family RNA polymerase sigma factor [Elainellaceae cyanobacterium]
MHPRQSILDIFASFIQFQADRFAGWVIDAKLRRSMQRSLDQINTSESATPHKSSIAPSEQFWALYWHRQWQTRSHPCAELHLVAYLQESCYWAAQLMLKRFLNTQYSLPDYFQMAIADVNTVLRDFDANRGASLKTFATIAFPRLLRDGLRQRHDVDLCSDWTLLRKVSKKRFLEALQHHGLPVVAVAQYRLAWNCFKQSWVQEAPNRKLAKPDRQLWQSVAEQYNHDRQTQQPPLEAATPEAIEKWLTTAALWVRRYLYPPVDSINRAAFAQDNEVQDFLPDLQSESLLADLIEEENRHDRQQQQVQLQTVLKTALTQLDSQSQTLLHLYYQEQLTQQEIVQRTQLSQATVSRRLTKAREALLMALVRWSQQTLNISPNPTLIKTMSTSLEEWLALHYGAVQWSSPPG